MSRALLRIQNAARRRAIVMAETAPAGPTGVCPSCYRRVRVAIGSRTAVPHRRFGTDPLSKTDPMCTDSTVYDRAVEEWLARST